MTMIESKTMNKPVIESKKVRKKFDRAFKERAVELWLNRGRAATEVAALEFGHSAGADLRRRDAVLSGGGGSDQGLVGGRCLCGGKGHWVVDQLLA